MILNPPIDYSNLISFSSFFQIKTKQILTLHVREFLVTALAGQTKKTSGLGTAAQRTPVGCQ